MAQQILEAQNTSAQTLDVQNFEQQLNSLFDALVLWSPKFVAAMAILLLFYLLAKGLKKIVAASCLKLGVENNLTSLFARTVNVSLILIGLVTALGTLGIDVSALVAGLGLTGFALGFALKDTISNIMSGVLILMYRPFKIGDHIEIAGLQGEVEMIDLRYTKLSGSEEKVLIPNAKLFTDPIKVKQKGKASTVTDPC